MTENKKHSKRLHLFLEGGPQEWDKAGLGHTLRTGTMSGWWVIPWHTGCQEEFKAGVCETPRSMQAWSGGRPTVCDTPVREAAKTRPKAHQHTLNTCWRGLERSFFSSSDGGPQPFPRSQDAFRQTLLPHGLISTCGEKAKFIGSEAAAGTT